MQIIKSNLNVLGQNQRLNVLSAQTTSTGRIIDFNTKCARDRYVCACISEK